GGAALRVAHDGVIGLRAGVVDSDRAARRGLEAPRVARYARALAISRVLPHRAARRGAAEDGGDADAGERRDAQAVIKTAGVFKGRACAVVEAADDVGVQEAMAAEHARLIRRVVSEGDAC